MRLYIALTAIFGDDMTAKGIENNLKTLNRCNNSLDATEVLWAFDLYLHVNPDLGKKFALILKALYEHDAVEEDDMLEHYKPTSKPDSPGYVDAKKFATPFLDWLQEESEDDSSDDDE